MYKSIQRNMYILYIYIYIHKRFPFDCVCVQVFEFVCESVFFHQCHSFMPCNFHWKYPSLVKFILYYTISVLLVFKMQLIFECWACFLRLHWMWLFFLRHERKPGTIMKTWDHKRAPYFRLLFIIIILRKDFPVYLWICWNSFCRLVRPQTQRFTSLGIPNARIKYVCQQCLATRDCSWSLSSSKNQ